MSDNPPASQARRFPKSASEYELRELIGQGTCASVYRAWCGSMDEEVAIKVVDLEWFNRSFEEIGREIQVMSRSSHTNVVPLSTAFVEQANLWIIMPLLIGGSVRSLMDCTYCDGLSEEFAVYVLWCVLKALEYFHSTGHIHRDVKAANLMLDSTGTVLLGDYGMMEWMDDNDGRDERETFFGTPCWMAPEVMEQVRGYDCKVDIWSLGITALELAQGLAPYFGSPPIRIFLLVLEGPPPSLSEEAAQRFSSSYKDFVSKCLRKDPKERLSASQLLQHPLFARLSSVPPGFAEAIASLPPLGSRDDAQEQVLRQVRKVAGPQGSGIAELVSKGLGWDFSDSSESENSSPTAGVRTPGASPRSTKSALSSIPPSRTSLSSEVALEISGRKSKLFNRPPMPIRSSLGRRVRR